MPVITQAIDSRDGVFIGGKHLHHTFKPMTNNELTLDQLTAISGGVQMGPDGSTCTDRRIGKILKTIVKGGSTGPFNPIDKDPGDNVGLPAENVSLYDH